MGKIKRKFLNKIVFDKLTKLLLNIKCLQKENMHSIIKHFETE